MAAWHLHSPPSHQNGTGARASATPGTSDHNIRRGPRPPVTSTHAGDQVHGHVLSRPSVKEGRGHGRRGRRGTGTRGGDRRYLQPARSFIAGRAQEGPDAVPFDLHNGSGIRDRGGTQSYHPAPCDRYVKCYTQSYVLSRPSVKEGRGHGGGGGGPCYGCGQRAGSQLGSHLD